MTPNGPTLWACGQSRVPGTRRIEHEDDWAGRCAGFPAMRSHEALGIVGWCQGGELNSRPRAYESPALPLSYPGKIAIAEEAKSKTVRSGFKSLCCSRDEFRLADGAGRDRCLSDIAFLWMAFSSRPFGDVGSPSGSRLAAAGLVTEPSTIPTNPFGDVTAQIHSRRARTRALPERSDNIASSPNKNAYAFLSQAGYKGEHANRASALHFVANGRWCRGDSSPTGWVNGESRARSISDQWQRPPIQP